MIFLKGLIGTQKTTFDLWGDAVNVASRMESSGVPSKIQVSEATYLLLRNKYRFEERGEQVFVLFQNGNLISSLSKEKEV